MKIRKILAVILVWAALCPAFSTPPVEPTYPGEGDILTAAFLYDAFHRLYLWASALEAGALTVIVETQQSTAGQTVFNLTNSFPLSKNRVAVFVGGIFQGVASQTSPNFTETTTTRITMTDPIPIASITVDFLIMKTYGE